MKTIHTERRGSYVNRCVCGYQADDANDLDEHIVAAARSEEEK